MNQLCIHECIGTTCGEYGDEERMEAEPKRGKGLISRLLVINYNSILLMCGTFLIER